MTRLVDFLSQAYFRYPEPGIARLRALGPIACGPPCRAALARELACAFAASLPRPDAMIPSFGQ